MQQLAETIHVIVWGPWTMMIFLATGIWFTVKSGGFQFFGFSQWWRETIGSIWEDFLCGSCPSFFTGNGKHGTVKFYEYNLKLQCRDPARDKRCTYNDSYRTGDSGGYRKNFQGDRKADAGVRGNLCCIFCNGSFFLQRKHLASITDGIF